MFKPRMGGAQFLTPANRMKALGRMRESVPKSAQRARTDFAGPANPMSQPEAPGAEDIRRQQLRTAGGQPY